ncbi:ferredoxin [Sporormia fimetaria CBS 119925]|uniref:Ferredoxin n=1 Tax=Sporormia fimetaria CBS 119925 TaxID=1340428 RepID=A0A6A6UZJ5_9PLEO|nr:ferredoxin [Sporormia fimetaria CBS 119925]
MAGPSSSHRMLSSAVSRALLRPQTSQSPSRIHIHRACSNWAPRISSAVTRSQLAPKQYATSKSGSSFALSHLILRRRAFSSSPVSQHGHIDPPKPGEELTVTFIDKEGHSHEFKVKEGDNLLDIAQANDLEMEGACGGSCACSTCHVIVDSEDYYEKMEEPDDDENDMLDLAFGLTETSRLGCQVKMNKDLDGLVVRLPSMTRNLQASDFVSK